MRDLLQQFKSDSAAGALRRAASGSLLLQIGLTGLSLLTNILLARWLGVTAYGAYSLGATWLGLLFLPAQLGLARLLVRQVAAYNAQGKWPEMGGILRFSFGAVLPFSILLALVVLVTGQLLPGALPEFALLALFMLQLPFSALTNLAGSAQRGLNQVLLGQVPTSLVNPLLMLLLLAAAVFLFRMPASAVLAAQLGLVSTAVAFVLALFLLWRAVPAPVASAPPRYAPHLWMAAAMPMLLTNIAASMNGRVGALMLGAMTGPDAVGIYNTAYNGVQLIIFGLMAANVAIEPVVARLYALEDMTRLQTLMTRSAHAISLYTVPATIGFVLFGRIYLGLFGPEFVVGYSTLVILSMGQAFSALMGSPGLLLTMSGYERETLRAMFLSLCVTVLLNWLLIPPWGLNGAAVAAVVGVVVWNVTMAVRSWQLLGISTPAFAGRWG
jgi:O-antigen/teichoic acid export membrane protein